MSIFSKPIFMALALAVAMPVAAQAAGKSQTVQFASGQSDANYRGSVRGYDYDRYTFNDQQGQLLNIRTDGSNPHIVAVVNYLGKGDGALLQTQDQVLPYSGRYEVRVMQTRNGARKSNQARPYVLNIAITGTPAPAVAATSAAAVTGEGGGAAAASTCGAFATALAGASGRPGLPVAIRTRRDCIQTSNSSALITLPFWCMSKR